MSDERAKQVWICTFCSSPHETEKQATQCWGSHSDLTIDYIFGGIGAGDMPLECVIKKHERGFVTKIATYTKTEEVEVKMRERRIAKRK